MSSPTYLTFDGDAANGVLPYRPGVADVGGCQKLDDQAYPPDPTTMPTAADFNQMGMQIVALGNVSCAAVIRVRNPPFETGDDPYVVDVRGASGLLAPGDFLVERFDFGTTTVRCSSAKIPPPFGGLAIVQQTGDYRVVAFVADTNDRIQVETRDATGTPASVDYLLLWI
jgi:hypothetical protein